MPHVVVVALLHRLRTRVHRDPLLCRLPRADALGGRRRLGLDGALKLRAPALLTNLKRGWEGEGVSSSNC